MNPGSHIAEKKGIAGPPAIRTYNSDIGDGLLNAREWPLLPLIAERHSDVKELHFTKPVILGQSFIMGTEASNTDEHLVILMDLSKLSTPKEAIRSTFSLKHEIRDLQWIHSELILCAAGEGALHLLSVDPTSSTLSRHGTLLPIHEGAIREIAINQASRAQFASGGHDRKLCLVNLERPEALQTIKQDGIIGSVRWPTWNQNVCPSVTLDDGTFLIYDIRVRPIGPPPFKATMGKKGLFAHERYTDHNVILGFDDGEMQHIDVRVTDRVLHKVQDPYVQAIGAIEYHSRDNVFLTSGCPDFTLWRHNVSTGEARAWGHSTLTKAPVRGETPWNATFVPDTKQILATSYNGYVALFER